VEWLEQVHCLLAQGTTVVSVLHEIGMALHADDIVVMREGRVVHHGAGCDASTHAAIEDVFGQRIRIHALDGQWVVLPRVGGTITGID
jgi:iron complex transport system ATP-binding protein